MTVTHPLKFRQLQYFLAVAELRHFTRAAEKLNVTQPTLSHQISELEQQLGTPLFDRVGKSVRLTEAGTLFHGYAEASIRHIESGRAALAELKGLERGALRIGASQSFARGLLPPLVGRFAEDYPGITLEIHEMGALLIETELAKGKLDIGLAYAPANLPQIVVEPLFEERLVLVVRPDHPLARRKTMPLAELDGVELALFITDYTTRKLLDAMLLQANATPRIVAVSNSVTVLLGMAETTSIGTIVLESSLNHHENFTVIPLTDPTPTRISALMLQENAFRSAAALRFAAMVRERLTPPFR